MNKRFKGFVIRALQSAKTVVALFLLLLPLFAGWLYGLATRAIVVAIAASASGYRSVAGQYKYTSIPYAFGFVIGRMWRSLKNGYHEGRKNEVTG